MFRAVVILLVLFAAVDGIDALVCECDKGDAYGSGTCKDHGGGAGYGWCYLAGKDPSKCPGAIAYKGKFYVKAPSQICNVAKGDEKCISITGIWSEEVKFFKYGSANLWTTTDGTRAIVKRGKHFNGCYAKDNVPRANCHPYGRWGYISNVDEPRSPVDIWSKPRKGSSSGIKACPATPAQPDPACLQRSAAYSFSSKSYGSVETWQACDRYCVDEQSMQCVAWSFRVESKTCLLYDKLTASKANEEFVSGTRGCAGCIEKGVFYVGDDVHTEIVTSLEACQAKCKEVERCNYFVWAQVGAQKHRCFLKQKKTGSIKLKSYSSGTKDCQKVEKKVTEKTKIKTGCNDDHTRLRDLTQQKFKRCDEALLKHSNMCTDASVKEACCVTCG